MRVKIILTMDYQHTLHRVTTGSYSMRNLLID